MSRESSLVPTNLLNWPRADALLPDQRLILIWLWAAPYMSSAGVGIVPIRPAAATLGLAPEALAGGLRTLQNAGVIDIECQTGEVAILDWFRFHKFKSPIQQRQLERDVEKIESPRLKKLIAANSMSCATTLTATRTATSTRTETETETENKPTTSGDGSNSQSESQTINPSSKKAAFVTVSEDQAFPEIEDRSLIADWYVHRAAKRARVTQTVIEGITREAAKAGYPIEKALRTSIERNWVGFEADWVLPKVRNGVAALIPDRHAGLHGKNYRDGLDSSGRFAVGKQDI